jgi:C4-dicarboxylate-specific signal transduction histidine kinase
MPQQTRQLAAIMFTDIVEYTRHLGIDSAKALDLVRISKEIQKFSVEKSNRSGIPEEIKDKIFQPFFTTKPTGSGTGLGLSLSYDIVKAHGGELKVESKEGEGSNFTIQLPKI